MNSVLDDILSRSRRFEQAVRDGSLPPESMKRLGERFVQVYKEDIARPVFSVGRGAAAQSDLANDQDASIPFVITALNEDRDGDVVYPLGCELENYFYNPVIFFGHQSWEVPIARSMSPNGELTVYPEEKQVVSIAYFDQADSDAMFIYGKIKRKFLNAASVAFVPIEAYRRDQLSKAQQHHGGDGAHGLPPGWFFKRWDKTEWSIVGVPSNPRATVEERNLRGALRDALDTEKNFITSRLQKALTPYCADGKCTFFGWTPTQKALRMEVTFSGDIEAHGVYHVNDDGSVDSEGASAQEMTEHLRGYKEMLESKSCGCHDCQSGHKCPCEEKNTQADMEPMHQAPGSRSPSPGQTPAEQNAPPKMEEKLSYPTSSGTLYLEQRRDGWYVLDRNTGMVMDGPFPDGYTASRVMESHNWQKDYKAGSHVSFEQNGRLIEGTIKGPTPVWGIWYVNSPGEVQVMEVPEENFIGVDKGAMSTTSGTSGGYTVPTEQLPQEEDKAFYAGGFRIEAVKVGSGWIWSATGSHGERISDEQTYASEAQAMSVASQVVAERAYGPEEHWWTNKPPVPETHRSLSSKQNRFSSGEIKQKGSNMEPGPKDIHKDDDLEEAGTHGEDKGGDSEGGGDKEGKTRNTFTPKPSAVVAAKMYRHLKDGKNWLDEQLKSMDHPGMSEHLQNLHPHLDAGMSHLEDGLAQHHPDHKIDKVLKALEGDGAGATEQTGEAGLVDEGQVPPEEDKDAGGAATAAPAGGEGAPDSASPHPSTMGEESGKKKPESGSPATEEILERYHDEKSGNWASRRIGTLKRVNGKAYILWEKNLTNSGKLERQGGSGSPLTEAGRLQRQGGSGSPLKDDTTNGGKPVGKHGEFIIGSGGVNWGTRIKVCQGTVAKASDQLEAMEEAPDLPKHHKHALGLVAKELRKAACDMEEMEKALEEGAEPQVEGDKPTPPAKSKALSPDFVKEYDEVKKLLFWRTGIDVATLPRS